MIKKILVLLCATWYGWFSIFVNVLQLESSGEFLHNNSLSCWLLTVLLSPLFCFTLKEYREKPWGEKTVIGFGVAFLAIFLNFVLILINGWIIR